MPKGSKTAGDAERKVAERNEARRRQYRDDFVYREQTKERYRNRYRKRAWGSVETQSDIRNNLKNMRRFGTVRKAGGRRGVTFTVPEVAALLGRSVSIYRRWLSMQQVPSPAHETDDGRVYLAHEASAFARVLAAHFDEMNYYRQDHVATKAALWKAYWDARKG